MADPWFAIRAIDEATFAITEPEHVNSFLIVGSERAVLLDTGMGVADIRSAVRGLTDRPVLAVNSHHHFDHVGGNHQFDDIAIHESGAELLRSGPDPQWVQSYWRGVADYLEQFNLATADPLASAAEPAESTMRPLPATFDPDHPLFVPSVATRRLREGDVIDLGDRSLRVIHTPGHSQDSICLLDRDHRLLFGADTVDSGIIYVHLPTSSVSDLRASLVRLVPETEGEIDGVLGAHSSAIRSDPGLIAQLASYVQELERGDVELEPTADCFGEPAQECRFDGVTLVVPLTWASAPTGVSTTPTGSR